MSQVKHLPARLQLFSGEPLVYAIAVRENPHGSTNVKVEEFISASATSFAVPAGRRNSLGWSGISTRLYFQIAAPALVPDGGGTGMLPKSACIGETNGSWWSLSDGLWAEVQLKFPAVVSFAGRNEFHLKGETSV